MDEAEARDALPPAYALALRMADAGAGTAAIAEAAGVDIDAVDALLEIGRAKLAELLAGESPDDDSELGV